MAKIKIQKKDIWIDMTPMYIPDTGTSISHRA